MIQSQLGCFVGTLSFLIHIFIVTDSCSEKYHFDWGSARARIFGIFFTFIYN